MRSLSWLYAVRNSIYLKIHCPLDYCEGKSVRCMSSCVKALCVTATTYLKNITKKTFK